MIMQYQICENCVMDSSDPDISFNSKGWCDHCVDFELNVSPNWNTGSNGRDKLNSLVEKIKKAGEGKDFDCLIGLSGGVDSSYLLHVMITEYNLRPLVFHVDGGWNSELSVHNINVLIDKLNLDLFTDVINWKEMRDFQLAFFKAGVPHIDIPQDHAFIAALYKYASDHNIKYILNGGNISTEVVRNPLSYYYWGTDMRQIKDIIKQFGTVPMRTYKFSSVLKHKLYLKYFRGVQVVKPLNLLPYNKSAALKLLKDMYGWKPYPQKHFESVFTKFMESYWLPVRFGFDVRRAQFSSLILTGQMTREEALEKLQIPSFSKNTINQDFAYIASKLEISVEELNHYLTAPKKFYWDYKNQKGLFDVGSAVLSKLKLDRGGVR
jgi:N-acetyl sugar amidotransferase